MDPVVRRQARSPAAVVAWAVLGTRLPLLLVGALAVTVVGTMPPPVSEALWRVSTHEVPNMLARWDSFFYNSIALHGYSWNPALFTYQNVVFFPLYPLLMRGLGAVIGGHPMIAGFGISIGAFTGALALLYGLAGLEIGLDGAWRTVVLVSLFPFAVFFSAIYTESLFLFLSVGAFYGMRRGHLGWAALCGLGAGLTRPNGFWLAVPLAALALWPHDRPAPTGQTRGAVPFRALFAASAPIVGMALFSAYLHVRFDDALAWVHGQAAWGMPLFGRWPAPDPIPIQSNLQVRATEWVVYAGDIAAFILAVAAIGPITRRCGIAYGLWIAVNIFPPIGAHLFESMGRFVSVLFPVFFWLALRIPRDRFWRVAGVFAAAQVLFGAWFFLWRAVI